MDKKLEIAISRAKSSLNQTDYDIIVGWIPIAGSIGTAARDALKYAIRYDTFTKYIHRDSSAEKKYL